MLRTANDSIDCASSKPDAGILPFGLRNSGWQSELRQCGSVGQARGLALEAPASCLGLGARTPFAQSRPFGPGLGRSAAFTLVEVVLGIFIAVGMLLVVLYLYRQSADLRTQLIQETERLMAVRLVMERLTTELRCAHGPATARFPFVGEATALRFATAALPTLSAWAAGPSSRSGPPGMGLKLVTYSLGSRLEGTNAVVSGLIRTEESAVPTRVRVGEPLRPKPEEPLAQPEVGQEPAPDSLEAPASGANWASADASPTGLPTGFSAGSVQPVIEAIRFVRFRYRAAPAAGPEISQPSKRRPGAVLASVEDWQETWTGPGLPQAVEVSLGTEPLPPEVAPEDYPYELFRRVIYLPSHAAGSLWANDSASSQPESSTEPSP